MVGTIYWVSIARSGQAETMLSAPVRLELKNATRELAELTRRDIESITLDPHQLVVPLATVNPQSEYRSTGVVVPFYAEGAGGGNMFEQFVALFALTDPDDQERTKQLDPERSRSRHPHIALLAFGQLDNRAKTTVEWGKAAVTDGLVTVPVTRWNCGGHSGWMTVRVDANHYGPRLQVEYDDHARLGPKGCSSD